MSAERKSINILKKRLKRTKNNHDARWKKRGAGRKALPMDQKKVNMTIKVKPATADMLRQRAKEEKVSIGTLIESLL